MTRQSAALVATAALLSTATGVQCGSPGEDVPQEQAPGEAVQASIPASCQAAVRNAETYLFCSAPLDFEGARASCASAGLALATIDDAAENEFIASSVAGPSYVGLTGRASDGVWEWDADGRLVWCGDSAGMPGDPAAFTSWDRDQPATPTCTRAELSGHRYWFCSDSRTWDDARKSCEAGGGSLAHVESGQENAFLAASSGLPTWLGGSVLADGSTWAWTDDTSAFWSHGHPVNAAYAHWGSGEPRGTGTCLLQSNGKNGYWKSAGCSQKHAWVCEQPVALPAETPNAADCAWIGANGEWSSVACDAQAGYVCETPPSGAGLSFSALVQSTRDSYHTGKRRITHLELRDGTDERHFFSRFGDELGLRDCVDQLVAVGESRPRPGGAESRGFQQHYHGLPVYTRGYSVLRNPQTEAIRSFSGLVAQGINVSIVPVVTQGDALQAAASAVGGSRGDYSPRPDGRLVIFPSGFGPDPTWRLAWLFALPRLAARQAYSVGIAADTGDPLMVVGSIREQCGSLDVSNMSLASSTPITINSFQTLQVPPWGDRNQALATPMPVPNLPWILLSDGAFAGAAGPKPRVYAACGTPSPFPVLEVATLDSEPVNVTWSSSENHYAAGLYLAAQSDIVAFANIFQTNDGKPWVGIDGTGESDVALRVSTSFPDGKPTGTAGWDPWSKTIYFNPARAADQFTGAALEMVGHELAHAVTQTFYQPIGFQIDPSATTDTESVSIGEGFAGVLGELSEIYWRGLPGVRDFCSASDFFFNSQAMVRRCVHDMKSPALSLDRECPIVTAGGSTISSYCPADYHGPDYCTLPSCADDSQPGCCGPHRNATVLEHWFYLLSVGGSAVNAVACPFTVKPIDPDPIVAARLAGNILFNAMRDDYFEDPKTGYKGLAEATINAAKAMFPNSTLEDIERVQSVMDAWYAVDVKEEAEVANVAKVEPGRDSATPTYPWARFKWPMHPGETRWDFQFSDGPFNNETGLATVYPKSDIQTRIDSEQVGYLDLAISWNTQKRFFWRVRPHDPNPEWLDCYPIHSFVGTSQPDEVANIQVTGDFEPGTGLVRPGTITVEWDSVRGATKYKLLASTVENPECISWPAVVERMVDADPSVPSGSPTSASLSGIQPEEQYYLYVQPFGPDEFDTTMGKCVGIATPITTAKMRPPELLDPPDGAMTAYHLPAEWPQIGSLGWLPRDGAERFRVSVFALDEQGEWGTEEVAWVEKDWIWVALDDVLPVPWNADGYCWSVQSLADNGHHSDLADPPWRFRYWYRHTWQETPGEQWGVIDHYRAPSPLPGDKDSWGSPVTLKWKIDPLAVAYGVKLGRWPWATPVAAPNPENCYGSRYGFGSNACDEEPSDVTFTAIQQQNTAQPPAGPDSSQGRYCWSVWPILEDPHNPGQVWSRQPAVELHPIFCYTSGPSQPEHAPVALPPEGEFTGAAIIGEFEFSYVPDSQLLMYYSSNDPDPNITAQAMTPGCTPTGPLFDDLFDCTYRYTIIPKPGYTYEIFADTYNSDAWGTPEMNADTLVHHVSSGPLFAGAECGERGQSCCANDYCEDTLFDRCWNGTCVACGVAEGSPCCSDPDNPCSKTYLECSGGQCVHCGNPNEVCCSDNPCNDPATVCHAGRCLTCGGMGDPCCTTGCSAPVSYCDPATNTCVGAQQCNEQVHQGSDNPETHVINLGSHSGGTVSFAVQTRTVPDSIEAYYEGNRVAFTDCVGTDNAEPASNGVIAWNEAWDDQGVRYFWRPIDVPGTSTELTVRVNPNCAGTVDTKWAFSVSCP